MAEVPTAPWRSMAWCASMLVAAAHASGQTIDLPRRVDPPRLGEMTAAMSLWGALEKEMAPLIDRERLETGDRRPVTRASINYRIIAADLLSRGDASGRAGGLAVLVGARLADHRVELDELLSRAVESPPPPGTPAAIAALERFNDGVLQLVNMPAPTDPARLDDDLHALLAPLAEATGALGAARAVSHWPSAREIFVPGVWASMSPPAAGTDPLRTISVEDLRARVTAMPLPDATRAVCDEILDFLKRGASFPDLAPSVQEYGTVLYRSLDLVDGLDEATWIGQAHRDAYDQRLHEALTLFSDRRTRARGRDKLDRLEASRRIIVRITALHRPGIDLKPIRSALLTTDTLIENAAEERLSQQQLGRLMLVLDRMIAFREQEAVSLRRELRTVEQQLRRLYLEAEDVLVREIETLAANPEALGDPAFSTMLADHAQYLEDLQRIRRIPDWVGAIGVMNPEASGPFDRQARKMSQWLLDSNRRPDAIRAIEQFEEQLDLFAELPLEADLSRPSADHAAVTGGRERELIAVIRNARHDWAAEWGRGNAGGGAAARMVGLYRLLQTIADVVELRRLGEDASALNRWAAWFMPRGAEPRTIDELRNRLKLATDAAVSGDSEQLLGQLDRIDRELPFVKLVGRLAKVLAPALEPLPSGVVAALGQSIHPPPPDAWWRGHRIELAELCRYAMERDHAAAAGETRQVTLLSDFVNARADDLLRELGERRTGPPTLSGFDGTDPEASDIETPVRRR